MNEVSVFSQQLPAHVLNTKSKAMQAMAGGLTGGGFGNRLSLRNSKFRFIRAGAELDPIGDPTLDVVIFALADSVQRVYYVGPYNQDSKDKPTCYSMDGKTPMPDSQDVQSTACATCPQNIKGSGRMGNTKACSYKKRVIVVSPYDITGDAYALDVNGMSMFGEQVINSNLYSFKGYFEKLTVHGADIAAMVTRLSFDDSASVPKLHFTPVRFLNEEDYAKVLKRAEDEDVALMLADMTNEAEENTQEEVPKAVAAPTRTPRAAAVATRPAPAPEATPAPAQTRGVGGLQRGGFPTGAPKVVNAAPAVAAAPKTAPVKIDLEGLVNFDDDKVQ